MSRPSSIDQELLAQAHRAALEIAPLAGEIEAARRLPPAAVRALAQARIFKLLVPRAQGGAEAALATYVAAIEAVARADGSAGWIAMIGSASGLMCGFLRDDVARAVYGPEDVLTCGVFAPLGRAVPVEGGFRVTGRWPFASGCQDAAWCMGGTLVEGDLLPSGAPNVRSVLFRASDLHILDTWDVSGLRGTGSHDFAVKDVFVPSERSFSLFTDRHAIAAYREAFFGALASGVAAVALGIARAAIDAFVALAKTKRTLGAQKSIAQRESVQLTVARAEAKLRAARAFLFDTLESVTHDIETRGQATVEERALLRLAACHAASDSAAAVDLVYEAAGASAIYATSPLQRHFRDVHTATQHLMVNAGTATLAGRLLLGIPTDTSTL
jgi:alkylation response protein AidB-like acyl-CoA dehydrogenase